MCGPQIWLCLFTFRPIASKQLNDLATIDILSWLGGAVVTHPLWVQEVQFPAPARVLKFDFFVLLFHVFTFCPKAQYLSQKFAIPFAKNLFSILNLLQDLWPIIRVQNVYRYRPSIFMIVAHNYDENLIQVNLVPFHDLFNFGTTGTIFRADVYWPSFLFVFDVAIFNTDQVISWQLVYLTNNPGYKSLFSTK